MKFGSILMEYLSNGYVQNLPYFVSLSLSLRELTTNDDIIDCRHYPLGVLYDLYANEELPWSLTVHFREFPTSQLLRCPNVETIQSHFNNTVKEVIKNYETKSPSSVFFFIILIQSKITLSNH
jgi:hypothetical protein